MESFLINWNLPRLFQFLNLVLKVSLSTIDQYPFYHTFPKYLKNMMHKNLVSFLDTNNIITNHQFGFCSGLSTFLALNQLHNYILRLNDSGQYTYGIFHNLKKAFDTVNHNITRPRVTNTVPAGTRSPARTTFGRPRACFENSIKMMSIFL